MAVRGHAAAAPRVRKPVAVQPEQKQPKRYRVCALRRRDQLYEAPSDEDAKVKGCKLIGARGTDLDSFLRAGGTGIFTVPGNEKVWPPTQH